jgi:high-affinity iron transporter
MVFWMKRTARHLKVSWKARLRRRQLSAPIAIAAAFFIVIREGLETSLFVYTNFQTVQDIASPTAGLVLGFAVSITLGFLIYKRAQSETNLSKFSVLRCCADHPLQRAFCPYGVHEFQELGYSQVLMPFVWDVTSFIAKDSILGASLSGTVGFDTTTSWLQLGVWVLYLGAVLVPYLAKPKVTAKA